MFAIIFAIIHATIVFATIFAIIRPTEPTNPTGRRRAATALAAALVGLHDRTQDIRTDLPQDYLGPRQSAPSRRAQLASGNNPRSIPA